MQVTTLLNKYYNIVCFIKPNGHYLSIQWFVVNWWKFVFERLDIIVSQILCLHRYTIGCCIVRFIVWVQQASVEKSIKKKLKFCCFRMGICGYLFISFALSTGSSVKTARHQQNPRKIKKRKRENAHAHERFAKS